MSEWKEILPPNHTSWHVQYATHGIKAGKLDVTWQTQCSFRELEKATEYLVRGALTSWPHAQWRLHNYELNETIPGELFVDAA